MNLRIESITLKEFRGILKCKKPIELSRFVVLIGRNDTGKSSILEALSLFPQPDYTPFYSGNKKSELVASLHSGKASLVYGYSGFASVEYVVDGEHLRWKLDTSGNVRDFSIAGLPQSLAQVDPFRSIEKILHVSSQEGISSGEIISSRMVFFMPSHTSFMQKLEDISRQSENQHFLTKTGAHVRVVKELINECVDDVYTEVFFTPEMCLRKQRADGSPLYISVKDVGSGVEKTTVATLWLDALNPSVVLWDDFEGFAHPTLVAQLLKWLEKKKWQVVISTHSIDVLSKVLEVRPEGCTIVQLNKTNADVLVHNILTLEQLEDIMDSSQDPRNLVNFLKL